MGGAFAVGLGALVLGALCRETVAPLGLLWAAGPRGPWWRAIMAVAAGTLVLVIVRRWPGMPAPDPLGETFAEVLRQKGPERIVGDALASYHAVWVLALLGSRVAPVSRLRWVAPAAILMLLVASVLSVLAVNTVRMFTLALPFMGLLVAELFEAAWEKDRRLSWGLCATFVPGWFVWFPTRPLGAAVSGWRPWQYLFALMALAACGYAWRRLRPPGRPWSELVGLPGKGGGGIP